MKSIIEAGIAILIVYLFIEWQKSGALASSATRGQASAAPGATAGSGGGCGCHGGGGGKIVPPMQNVFPAPIGYDPVTFGGFGSSPVLSPSAPIIPAKAPPVKYYGFYYS
jgi:hypothetical protein